MAGPLREDLFYSPQVWLSMKPFAKHVFSTLNKNCPDKSRSQWKFMQYNLFCFNSFQLRTMHIIPNFLFFIYIQCLIYYFDCVPDSESEVSCVRGDRPQVDPHGEQQVLQGQLTDALSHLEKGHCYLIFKGKQVLQ